MRHGCNPNPDACGGPPYELPRYFPGQLLTDDELTQEQEYFRARLRLHNRLLWGWGTVCGALVCRVPAGDGGNAPDPWKVKVKPGYLLGPYGDDIVLGADVFVDLRSGGVSGNGGEAPEAAADDPWCSRVCLPREPGPLYVAVRYRECLTRPVRVQPAGCGCSGEQCEYSRLRDGYEIGILDRCPRSHEGEPPEFSPCSGEIPACPPCPDDPWVVLARVEIDADGIVGEPDNCACRRIVLSLAPFWCRCEEAPGDDAEPEATITGVTWRRPDGSIAAAEFARGDVVTATVAGTGFTPGSRVDLGRGFEIASTTLADGMLTATIKVLAGATVGSHALRVVDAQGHLLVERADAFRVVAANQPAPPAPPAPPSPVPGGTSPPPAGGGTGGGTDAGAGGASPGPRGAARRGRGKSGGGGGG